MMLQRRRRRTVLYMALSLVDSVDDGPLRDIAKCCPRIARDTQTDVSRTIRGVRYVISG